MQRCFLIDVLKCPCGGRRRTHIAPGPGRATRNPFSRHRYPGRPWRLADIAGATPTSTPRSPPARVPLSTAQHRVYDVGTRPCAPSRGNARHAPRHNVLDPSPPRGAPHHHGSQPPGKPCAHLITGTTSTRPAAKGLLYVLRAHWAFSWLEVHRTRRWFATTSRANYGAWSRAGTRTCSLASLARGQRRIRERSARGRTRGRV
jgi:hypothetical protein